MSDDEFVSAVQHAKFLQGVAMTRLRQAVGRGDIPAGVRAMADWADQDAFIYAITQVQADARLNSDL